MSLDNAKHSQAEAHAGLAALRGGAKDDAGLHFLRALASLDDVPQPLERRNLLSEIAEFFAQEGFEDLALMAALEAIAADEQLGLERGLAKDRITYANLHLRLGNMEQAEAIYRALIDRCLQQKDYANAASASTNLAGILANNNYPADAIRLLENSLEYLQFVEFPATELNTLFLLIQVLELQKAAPTRTYETARTLIDRFASQLSPQHHHLLSQFVDSALERQAQIGFDAATWKRQHFPELTGA